MFSLSGAKERPEVGGWAQRVASAKTYLRNERSSHRDVGTAEVDLYTRLSAAGFHCSQFFYHCFMSLYAAVLPESALFRLWDRVFFWSGQKAATASKITGPRSCLVEFAFAAMSQRRSEGGYGLREQLESCQTTAEVRSRGGPRDGTHRARFSNSSDPKHGSNASVRSGRF